MAEILPIGCKTPNDLSINIEKTLKYYQFNIVHGDLVCTKIQIDLKCVMSHQPTLHTKLYSHTSIFFSTRNIDPRQ